ncbi:stereocilin [Caenimonas aquaedulcis]|uniref:Stereocilin n=1 Tax=Caenimonas aquaedulcis TaxID=2793270 RepID=A0A931H806_9BURK|nr:stereocilin [Caenimonas aquaedulcis]MBG9390117.1 stereocilin [Caenimonas aquaedulcis]
MATHPVEPQADEAGSDTGAPNPTHLPVEPEFGPALPPAEPEEPHGQPPKI